MFCGCFRGTYVQLPSVRVRFQIYTGVPSRRGAGPYRWVTRARAMPAPRRTRRWPGNSRRRRPAPADRAGRPTRRARARRCARRAAVPQRATPAPRRRPGHTRGPSRARCRRCARRRPRQRPPGRRVASADVRSLAGIRFDLLARERLLEHAAGSSPPRGSVRERRGATRQSRVGPSPGARPRGDPGARRRPRRSTAAPRAVAAGLAAGGAARRRPWRGSRARARGRQPSRAWPAPRPAAGLRSRARIC